MTPMTFDTPSALHLLWLVAALTVLGAWALRRRRQDLARFASTPLLKHLLPQRRGERRRTRLVLYGCGFALLTIALAGPRWGAADQQSLRRDADVLIVLDVSRSMAAEDVRPSRLGRATLALRDDLLPVLGGERVGLLTFAGDAVLVCPLTVDYGAFRLALETLTERGAERGGSMIGDALRSAAEHFPQQMETHRLIVLISDGEDHGSFAREAAAALWADHRIGVISVALGDSEAGARIPAGNDNNRTYVQYGGEDVRSRADFVLLRGVAEASPAGRFVPAGTGDFDLGSVYRAAIADLRIGTQEQKRNAARPARFHIFALLALALLLFDAWWSEPALQRPTLDAGDASSYPPPWQGGAGGGLSKKHAAVTAILFTALLAVPLARADSTGNLVSTGNAHYAAGRFAEALDTFERAAATSDAPYICHNQAATLYQLGRFTEAQELWREVQGADDIAFEARAVYNIGNCDYQAALHAIDGEPQQAAAHIAQAITHYRDAIRLDPTLTDARANLELAARLEQQIRALCEAPPEDDEQPSDKTGDNESSSESSSQDEGDPGSDESPDATKADTPEEQAPPQGASDPESTQFPEEDAERNQAPSDEQPITRMTRDEAERLLQIVRDAQQKRMEQLAEQKERDRRPVERDW